MFSWFVATSTLTGIRSFAHVKLSRIVYAFTATSYLVK